MPRPPLAADVAAFAVERTGRARIELRGNSMAPTLRAGMVADIERLDRTARAGDIVVFRGPAGLVAHRLIAVRGESFILCGDALPDVSETVMRERIVGRVSAVWSGPGPDARRLDDRLSRTRAGLMLHSRGARAALRRARSGSRSLLQYAAPRLSLLRKPVRDVAEPPAFRQLVAASFAFEAGDAAGGVAALERAPAEAIVSVTVRHQMGGLISRWLESAATAGVPVPAALREPFRQTRFVSALQATRATVRLRSVIAALRTAGIDAIALKGGARLARADADAQLHYAADIDVLVPAADIERATATLLAAGYRQQFRADRISFFAQRHQHVAPLIFPGERVPVELHVALSTPRSVSQSLDYARLLPHSHVVDGPAGAVRVLDRVHSALHLAYHGHDLRVWRDIVLLANALREMTSAERNRFDLYVRAERRNAVRLCAAIVAAEALLGRRPRPEPAVERYLAWAIEREDFPELLRRRCHIIEGLVAHSPRHYLGWQESLRQFKGWAYNAALTLPILRYWRWSSQARGPTLAVFGLRDHADSTMPLSNEEM